MKINTNGVDINYVIEGDGPWLTMSHSLACDLHMWDEEARRLSQRYRVLRFDTRGHGASSAPAGAYSLDMLADDLHGVLQALGVQATHFVGLSLGGMIGQTYALKSPGTFKSLVLCDTTSRYPEDWMGPWAERVRTAETLGLEPLVEPTMARFFSEAFRNTHPSVVDKTAATMRATRVLGYLGCCHAISKLNLTSRLKEIRCPTLIVVGEQDPATPVTMSEEIHQAMPGSRLAVIPSAAHLANVEQPDAINQLIEDFLNTVDE